MSPRAPWDVEVAGGVACVVLALVVGTAAPALSVGLSGWGVDGLTAAARRWRDGETGRGDVVERPPVKDAAAFRWGRP